MAEIPESPQRDAIQEAAKWIRNGGVVALPTDTLYGLAADPFSGCVFVFRNRRQTALRLLCYDGQGFWLAHKRLSRGRFRWWPTSATPATTLEAHQLQRLIVAGDPLAPDAAPVWRRVRTG